MFNWFWEFLYNFLIKVPLLCIDIILMVARKLCGIDPVQIEREVNGQKIVEDVDILTYFMQGETILNAFGYVCLFAFILLFLFTAFRIVKDQLTFYEKKSPIRICLDSSKILLFFLLIPAIMIAGTTFVSTLMRGIFEATSNSGEGLGGAMFVLFAEEAYIGPKASKQQVLDAFRTCSLEEYMQNPNALFYYNIDKVTQYFNLSQFNFFLGWVGSFSVVILLSLTLLSFVERIISLIMLFIIAPLPISASPLDDGERFKMWREQTINKFITAYGGLLALNIFSLMLPMIANMNFFSASGELSSVINGIARLLFIIGGAFACRRGMVLIGNLVARGAGSQDLMDQSHLSGGMAALAHMAGRLLKGTVGTVTGAAGGAFNKGRSWLQAGDVPTSIAEFIRKKTNENKSTEEAKKAAEANRFDGKVDRDINKNGAGIETAMKGKSDASRNTDKDKPIQAPSKSADATSSANNEKNNETNKEAQNDIKSALQNKKSDDNKDETKKD